MKEQLQGVEESMYNSDTEDIVYQKEKLEDSIKRKYSLVFLLEEKQGTCEKLEEENR